MCTAETTPVQPGPRPPATAKSEHGSCLRRRSCNKPVGAHQTVKFVPAEIDRATAHHQAATFCNDDLRIFAEVMHDLLGLDQWPDALGISDVLAARAGGHVELLTVTSSVLRFRPGEHAVQRPTVTPAEYANARFPVAQIAQDSNRGARAAGNPLHVG
jgi:hypothetical protein